MSIGAPIRSPRLRTQVGCSFLIVPQVTLLAFDSDDHEAPPTGTTVAPPKARPCAASTERGSRCRSGSAEVKQRRAQIRRTRFHLRSDLSFADIARMINSRAGAWAAYYGRFCPSEPLTSCSTSTGTSFGGPAASTNIYGGPHGEQRGSWPVSRNPGRDSSRTGDGRPCNERLQREPDDRSPVS